MPEPGPEVKSQVVCKSERKLLVYRNLLGWPFPRHGVPIGSTDEAEVPPVAVPLPMLDPEPSVVPGVGAS